MENKPLNLHQKLVEVRKAVPTYIKKDAKSHAYTYLKESTVLGLISDPMNNHGLLLTQEIMSLEDVTVSDKKGLAVPGIRATLNYTWINAECPEQVLKLTQVLQDSKSDIQGCGGILTYGMRYFLLKFFNVATDTLDPDNFKREIDVLKDDMEDENELISSDKAEVIRTLVKESGSDEAGLLKWAGASSVSEIKSIKADHIITTLGKKLQQKRA